MTLAHDRRQHCCVGLVGSRSSSSSLSTLVLFVIIIIFSCRRRRRRRRRRHVFIFPRRSVSTSSVVFLPSRPSSSSSCVRRAFRRRRRRRCLGCRSSPSQRLRHFPTGAFVPLKTGTIRRGRRIESSVDSFAVDRAVRVRTPLSSSSSLVAPPPRPSAA